MSNYDNSSHQVQAAYSDGKWWGRRERELEIIALLKESLDYADDIGIFDTQTRVQLDADDIINIIKGENK